MLSLLVVHSQIQQTIDMVKTGGRKLIVGHTPSKLSDIISSVNSNKILLDGGCVYKLISDKYGYLVAYNIDTKVLYYVENMEKQAENDK